MKCLINIFLLFAIAVQAQDEKSISNPQKISAEFSDAINIDEPDKKLIRSEKKVPTVQIVTGPGQESIRINFSHSAGKKLSYLLSNYAGETVMMDIIRLHPGQQSLDINIPLYVKDGNYFIQLISDKSTWREKLSIKRGIK